MRLDRDALINAGILAITMLLVSLVLVVGTDTGGEAPPEELAVGQPSPETFIAPRSTDPIVDKDATDDARIAAANSVETVYTNDNEATLSVIREVNSFFDDLSEGAIDESLIPGETTSTTSTTVVETSSSTEPGETTTSTSTTTTLPPTTTTTTLPRRSIEDQIALLNLRHAKLSLAIPTMVSLYNNDLDRVAEGEDASFPEVEAKTLEIVGEELESGIKPTELSERQDLYINPLTRPPIFVPGLPIEEQSDAREGIALLVGFSLQANLRVDNDATAVEREAKSAAVEPVTVTYRAGDTIVVAGATIGSIEFEAIQQLGLYEPVVTGETSRVAMALLGILAVLLAAFFLWRIAPKQWSQPRHMALLGILLTLAALISRLPSIIAVDNRALGYLLPAVAIGFLAAILFDPRTAVVLAIPCSVDRRHRVYGLCRDCDRRSCGVRVACLVETSAPARRTAVGYHRCPRSGNAGVGIRRRQHCHVRRVGVCRRRDRRTHRYWSRLLPRERLRYYNVHRTSRSARPQPPGAPAHRGAGSRVVQSFDARRCPRRPCCAGD